MKPFEGENRITLNQATMVRAMQTYLDEVFALNAAPKVTKIEHHSSSDSFVVHVNSPEKTK